MNTLAYFGPAVQEPIKLIVENGDGGNAGIWIAVIGGVSVVLAAAIGAGWFGVKRYRRRHPKMEATP